MATYNPEEYQIINGRVFNATDENGVIADSTQIEHQGQPLDEYLGSLSPIPAEGISENDLSEELKEKINQLPLKGDPGEQGPQGERGEKGDKGDPADLPEDVLRTGEIATINGQSLVNGGNITINSSAESYFTVVDGALCVTFEE